MLGPPDPADHRAPIDRGYSPIPPRQQHRTVDPRNRHSDEEGDMRDAVLETSSTQPRSPRPSRARRLARAAPTLALYAALAAIAAPATADNTGPPPPLLADEFGEIPEHVPANGEIRHTCNLDGSGELRYRVTGQTTGPYPGTFTETATATFGPAVDLLSKLTSFKASFTITSPAAQITGTETAVGPGPPPPPPLPGPLPNDEPPAPPQPFNVSQCLANPFQPDPQQFIRGLNISFMCYRATITTRLRKTNDRGAAVVSLSAPIFDGSQPDLIDMNTLFHAPAANQDC
jgi:hypothetical protein